MVWLCEGGPSSPRGCLNGTCGRRHDIQIWWEREIPPPRFNGTVFNSKFNENDTAKNMYIRLSLMLDMKVKKRWTLSTGYFQLLLLLSATEYSKSVCGSERVMTWQSTFSHKNCDNCRPTVKLTSDSSWRWSWAEFRLCQTWSSARYKFLRQYRHQSCQNCLLHLLLRTGCLGTVQRIRQAGMNQSPQSRTAAFRFGKEENN